MIDYIELFTIVPLKDGYHFLKRAKDGTTYLAHKANDSISIDTLLFKTEAAAQKFIDSELDDPRIWKPEYIIFNKMFIDKYTILE